MRQELANFVAKCREKCRDLSWNVAKRCRDLSRMWYDVSMEKLDRKERVRQAIANERLEGLTVSRATRRTLDDYANGKISAEEAADQVFSRYGVK